VLSVLSYNIFFGKRTDDVVEWLASLPKQVDILCFQEFPKEKIPFLKKALQPEAYAFASNVIYKGKDYGQLTVVMNKRITLVDEAEIKLGTNLVEDKILRLKGERSSLLTTLRYKRKNFLLANTHLIAFALNALRRKQLALVVEHIETVSQEKKTIPTLVLGDLNYSSLLWRHKFFAFMKRNKFRNAHMEKTHRLFLKYHQLDYIFYKSCKVTDVQILKKSFSDHLPMLFKLQI
jgi:endonuclease/exonuclease/phosphatase family metal-dependent hydrolase